MKRSVDDLYDDSDEAEAPTQWKKVKVDHQSPNVIVIGL